MFDFIKTCGQGLLYLILSPFLLLLVVGYSIYSFFVFFFMLAKRVVMFFSGMDMKEDMKIDKLAKLHIKQQDQETEEKNSLATTPVIEKTTNTVVQPIIIQTDENGVLKSVQMPNSTLNNQNAIDNVPNEAIETTNNKQESGDENDE